MLKRNKLNYFPVLVSLLLLLATNAYSQVPEKAIDISPLLIGESIPDAQLLTPDSSVVKLGDIVSAKPTVLVFYRGGWCPFCNSQLAALAVSSDEIVKLGYQIIAVTPDNFKMLNSTMKDDKVNYKLFADPDGALIQKIGIAFKTPDKSKAFIAERTKLKATEVLPVPTVFVLNTKGEILFEYINPNYKTRISPELLLAVLKNLHI